MAHSRYLKIITSFSDVDTIITLVSICRQAPHQLWWQSSGDAVILAALHLEVIWPQNTSSDVSGFHAYNAHTVTLHMSKSTVKEGTCYMLTLEKDKCLSHKAFTRRWSSILYALHPVHPICEYTGLWLEALTWGFDLRTYVHLYQVAPIFFLFLFTDFLFIFPHPLNSSLVNLQNSVTITKTQF